MNKVNSIFKNVSPYGLALPTADKKSGEEIKMPNLA
jgi:hypothetical protein